MLDRDAHMALADQISQHSNEMAYSKQCEQVVSQLV
jgi:hypothetical protein